MLDGRVVRACIVVFDWGGRDLVLEAGLEGVRSCMLPRGRYNPVVGAGMADLACPVARPPVFGLEPQYGVELVLVSVLALVGRSSLQSSTASSHSGLRTQRRNQVAGEAEPYGCNPYLTYPESLDSLLDSFPKLDFRLQETNRYLLSWVLGLVERSPNWPSRKM